MTATLFVFQMLLAVAILALSFKAGLSAFDRLGGALAACGVSAYTISRAVNAASPSSVGFWLFIAGVALMTAETVRHALRRRHVR